MNWRQERDALIAQTMDLVHSISVARAQLGKPSAMLGRLESEAETARLGAIATALNILKTPQSKSSAEPVSKLAARTPSEIPNDLRAELKERIASFRKHQERFNREREEYFKATLSRFRAAMDQASPPPPPRST